MKKIELPQVQMSEVEMLKFQNKLLVDLYNLQVEKINSDRRDKIVHFILQLIPFIVILILLYVVYTYVMSAINSVNVEVQKVKSGFDTVMETINAQKQMLEGIYGKFKGGIDSVTDWLR